MTDERPRDRFRRYLMMEMGSYEVALAACGHLELTTWKLAVAKEMLDYFDAVELREAKAKNGAWDKMWDRPYVAPKA